MPRRQIRPPIKLRRKFGPLIALCRERILTAPPQTSGSGDGDKVISVNIRWPLRAGVRGRLMADLPKGFPTGTTVERSEDSVLIRHSVVSLLSYFKQKNYCNFDASDLFSLRLPVLMRLAKLELKLDRLVEDINVDLEQQAQELLDES